MMVHRLKAAAAAAGLILAAFLTGCHGSQSRETFSVPASFDETKQYEITFWAKNDTNINQRRIYENAIADFEKLYPNITVNASQYTDYGKIYNDVITNIATGTTPNVCISYPDHIATYLTGNQVVVPLDELFSDEKYGLGGSEVKFDSPTAEELIPAFMDECILQEHYYAVPFMRSTEACYINKTFVEKLGYTIPDILTWDFVWEVSEAAAKKDEAGNFLINGQKYMIPFIYKSTDNMMIQMLKQQDAGYSTEDGKIELFNDATREILYTVADHVKTGAFSTFKISSYPANSLNAGQCIFAIDSTAGATWMGSEAPLLDIPPENVVEFETEVRAVPQFDTENPEMISQGPSLCIFNKQDPQEVLAAWLFVQYLLSNDVQIPYSETEGYIPVTSRAQDSAEYKEYLSHIGENNSTWYDVKIKAAELLLSNLDHTFTTPVFNGSASLRDAAGTLIENVAKSVRRKKTVDDAFIDSVFSDVQSLYRLDQIHAGGGKTELGPLPAGSKALIGCLIAAWILILIYVLCTNKKYRKKSR